MKLLREDIKSKREQFLISDEEKSNILIPWWLGYEVFHYSHCSALLRKDPEYYSI